MCDSACKPGYVVNGHLSLRRVAATLHRKLCATRGYVSGKRSPCGVASDKVYSGPVLPRELAGSCPAFPPLPRMRTRTVRRFISVALSRRSPEADVICYPALRSPDFPHGKTFRHDTARPSGKVTQNIIPLFYLKINIYYLIHEIFTKRGRALCGSGKKSAGGFSACGCVPF